MDRSNSKNYSNVLKKIDDYYMANEFTQALDFLSSELQVFSNGQHYCSLKIYEAHLLSITGELDACMVAASLAREEADRINLPLYQVKAIIELIYAKWMVGSLQEALNLVLTAEGILKEQPSSLDLNVTWADLLNTKGIIEDNLGKIQESMESFEQSLKLRKEIGNQDDIAVSLNNLAIIYQNTGKMEKAYNYLQESLEIKRASGNKLDVAYALSNLAIYYRKNGEFQKAFEILDECYLIYDQYGNLQDKVNNLLNKLLFSEITKDFETLERTYEKFKRLLQLHSEKLNPSIQLNLDIATAVYLHSRGEDDVATEIFQQVVDAEIIDHTLTILAIKFLIEIKIIQISKATVTNALIREIYQLINQLEEVSQKEQLFPLHVVTIIFKAKLGSREGKFDEARSYLYQALRIAEKHLFNELILKIHQEIDVIDEFMKEENVSPSSDLNSYIDLIKNTYHE